jgi:hypothetical protein
VNSKNSFDCEVRLCLISNELVVLCYLGNHDEASLEELSAALQREMDMAKRCMDDMARKLMN